MRSSRLIVFVCHIVFLVFLTGFKGCFGKGGGGSGSGSGDGSGGDTPGGQGGKGSHKGGGNPSGRSPSDPNGFGKLDPRNPDSPLNPDNPESPFNKDNPKSPFNPNNPESPFHKDHPDNPSNPNSPRNPDRIREANWTDPKLDRWAKIVMGPGVTRTTVPTAPADPVPAVTKTMEAMIALVTPADLSPPEKMYKATMTANALEGGPRATGAPLFYLMTAPPALAGKFMEIAELPPRPLPEGVVAPSPIPPAISIDQVLEFMTPGDARLFPPPDRLASPDQRSAKSAMEILKEANATINQLGVTAAASRTADDVTKAWRALGLAYATVATFAEKTHPTQVQAYFEANRGKLRYLLHQMSGQLKTLTDGAPEPVKTAIAPTLTTYKASRAFTFGRKFLPQDILGEAPPTAEVPPTLPEEPKK